MKYAFVLVSVVAMWVALLLMTLRGGVNSVMLYGIVLALTVILYVVGFRRAR